MFGSVWSWLAPVLGAALVFAGVLLTTPPGFGAIGLVLFGSPRGALADAAAYAIGAAATLALGALLALAAITQSLDAFVRRRAR
jgi:hypothetical protein